MKEMDWWPYLVSDRFFLNISVDRYDYVVNGEALKEIHEYMEVEHTFAEYTEVCMGFQDYS